MPKTFVVVGDTDWWSTTNRSPNMAYDSRLRGFAKIGAAGWTSIVGANARDLTTVPVYAEIGKVAGSSVAIFGVCSASAIAGLLAGYVGQNAQSAGYYSVGQLICGAAIQSVATFGNDDVIGVSCYLSAGTPVAQFRKNGAPVGTPVTLPATRVQLAASLFDIGDAGCMLVDASEMRFLPAGERPWGAAARAADASGYSAEATRLDPALRSSTNLTVDALARTAQTAVTGWDSVHGTRARATGAARFYWVEFQQESGSAGAITICGLSVSGTAAAGYPGASANGWGFYFSAYDTYHAGAATSYGSTPVPSTDRIAALWEPATGKLWFYHLTLAAGVWTATIIGGGNPLLGTSPAYSNATGSLVPTVGVNANGGSALRTRMFTHAREQVGRPEFASAWDGADILPEQRFEGRLLPRTAVARQLQFALRGSAGQRTAVGSVVIGNAGGEFDRVADWPLRNQGVIGYYIDDTYSDREFTGVIDSIKRGGFSELEVRVGDGTAPLDVRVDSPMVVLGEIERAPLIARQGADLIFDVAPTALWECGLPTSASDPMVDDGGLGVATWARVPTSTNDPTAHLGALKRTVKPVFLQSLHKLRTYSIDGDVTGLNFNLNAWTGNTPNSWTKTEASGGTVTAAASNTAARLQGAGTASSYAAIHQGALTHPGGASEFEDRIFVGLNITVNTSGDLQIALEEFVGAYPIGGAGTFAVTKAKVTGGGTGWFWVPLPNVAGSLLSYLSIYTARTGGTVDITVTEVRVLKCSAYRLPSVAGVTFAANADNTGQLRCSGTPAALSYWSDKRPTRRQLLSIELESTLADCFTDAYGRVLTAYLTEPEAVLTTDACYIGDILESDCAGDLVDEDEDFPSLSDIAWYAPSFVVHTDTDIAASVTGPNRAPLLVEAQQLRLAVPGAGAADAKAFDPFYAHGVGGPPWRRYVSSAGSTSPNPAVGGTDKDLIRLHRIAGVRRRGFNVPLKVAFFRAKKVRPGCVATLYHRRFGLAAGKRVQFLSAPAALMATTVVCKVIG